MSVDQQTTISCDAREGCTSRHAVDQGLVDARTLAADAGWRNELLFVGIERKPWWRDLCPLHTSELAVGEAEQ